MRSLLFFVLVASSLAAARDEAVLAAAERQRADALRTLERLVNIDTETGHVPGLQLLGEYLADELARLGAQVQRLSAAPMAGQNIVATFTGTGRGRILLMAHTDTVFKPGTAKERPFRIEGSRAFGPGVADDKGGVVAGLYALKILRELGFHDYATITFLLNPNEETGSLGTRGLIQTLARKHDVVLNLEPGRAGDKVLRWRKGTAVIEVTVKGKSAHAGTAPETGRNAALEAAHQALQISRLADPEKRTTVSVTVLQAGRNFNVIPDSAVLRADVRALAEPEFQRVERQLQESASRRLIADTEVTARLTRNFPPLPQNPTTDALITRAQAIYAELGRTLEAEGTGGGSDGSYAAATGTPTLDALGFSGGNPHSEDEYVDLTTVVPRLYLLTRLVMELGRAM